MLSDIIEAVGILLIVFIVLGIVGYSISLVFLPFGKGEKANKIFLNMFMIAGCVLIVSAGVGLLVNRIKYG